MPDAVALDCRVKTELEKLIGREKTALEILREQNPGDQNPTDDETQGQLQKHEVAAVTFECPTRQAKKCHAAGLGGHDGDEHQPPANVAIADQIRAHIALAAREPYTQDRGGENVGDDDDDVHGRELREKHHRPPRHKDRHVRPPSSFSLLALHTHPHFRFSGHAHAMNSRPSSPCARAEVQQC